MKQESVEGYTESKVGVSHRSTLIVTLAVCHYCWMIDNEHDHLPWPGLILFLQRFGCIVKHLNPADSL